MVGRRLITILAGMLATMAIFAGTAFAHYCYNPNKPDGAGVNYTLTGFNGGEPIFTQTGPGQGIGGFVDAFGTDVHSIGNSGARGDVGNPEKMPERLLCDGQGIDYLGCP